MWLGHGTYDWPLEIPIDVGYLCRTRGKELRAKRILVVWSLVLISIVVLLMQYFMGTISNIFRENDGNRWTLSLFPSCFYRILGFLGRLWWMLILVVAGTETSGADWHIPPSEAPKIIRLHQDLPLNFWGHWPNPGSVSSYSAIAGDWGPVRRMVRRDFVSEPLVLPEVTTTDLLWHCLSHEFWEVFRWYSWAI